jgi:hypothetical protein
MRQTKHHPRGRETYKDRLRNIIQYIYIYDILSSYREAAQNANTNNSMGLIETIEQLTAQVEKEQREREMEIQTVQKSHQQEMSRLFERQKFELEALRLSLRESTKLLYKYMLQIGYILITLVRILKR